MWPSTGLTILVTATDGCWLSRSLPSLAAAWWGYTVWPHHSSAPSYAEGPVQCKTRDSLSCYYVNSNRPVSGAQSVVFVGGTVPVVGLEPSYCKQSQNNCPYLGFVGEYAVSQVQNGPNLPSRLEAVFTPTPPGTTPG